MNLVIRGVAIYFFILIIFRISGKRVLSEATTFDFVLLVIISEVTQQAMVGNDFSLSAAFILITTLVSADLLLNLIKLKSKKIRDVTDGQPLVIVNKGELLSKRMKKARINYDEILEAARSKHGIKSIKEIDFAVLELDGSISIIPKKEE